MSVKAGHVQEDNEQVSHLHQVFSESQHDAELSTNVSGGGGQHGMVPSVLTNSEHLHFSERGLHREDENTNHTWPGPLLGLERSSY